jgi:hypothetical protein
MTSHHTKIPPLENQYSKLSPINEGKDVPRDFDNGACQHSRNDNGATNEHGSIIYEGEDLLANFGRKYQLK